MDKLIITQKNRFTKNQIENYKKMFKKIGFKLGAEGYLVTSYKLFFIKKEEKKNDKRKMY